MIADLVDQAFTVAHRDDASNLRHVAACMLADTAACTIRDSDHPTVMRMKSYLAGVGRTGSSAPLAGGALDLTDAVHLDALAAHVDEFDAVHPSSGTVPGAVIVPASVLVGEAVGAGFDQVLGAVIGGTEALASASLTLGGPALYGRGWWPAAVAGAVGSAVSTSLLLGLDQTTTTAAVALACTGSGGLLSDDTFGDGHYLLVADVAARGVRCAYLARDGMRASPRLLEGPARRAFGSAASSDPPAGPEPHVLGVMLKEFPVATPLQAAIRAAERLPKSGKWTRIDVRVPAAMRPYLSADVEVEGGPEAAASAAYAVAAALAGSARRVETFRFPDRASAQAVVVTLGMLDSLSSARPSVEISASSSDGTRSLIAEPVRTAEPSASLLSRKLAALFVTPAPFENLLDVDVPASWLDDLRSAHLR